ncbi:uncharacterized protein SPPG_05603 [Spizellomyces punctatus DAOM BR117]|uniref:Uncharacterized protein n=1 Tax=Spizellomyces punctatus (strain DAOM BR117) TaxID=645134 RepID=A0A0L0HE22_SPIPD|nr:uncharacterized protein SPPG_05603 [Spizellomyces punctatus DAOM BR117]KNC99357.1 hypothetical protein SPPG_05603 [Spizellomyces punctatus DAOM BR117]|eukprot:XP_016607397.1 hypothetical protein SPPG_05603 [Spizellomyces punctatus DAOM BR117]
MAHPDTHTPLTYTAPVSRLQAFQIAHFSTAAKSRFLNPRKRTYWDSLCGNCEAYWSSYSCAQPSETPDDHITHTSDTTVQQETHEHEKSEQHVQVPVQEDEQGDESEWLEDAEPTYSLTPDMIAMFRHSEMWRRERKAQREAEAQAERDAVKVEENRVTITGALPTTSAQSTNTTNNPPNSYSPKTRKTIQELELELNAQFQRHVQTRRPVLWPVLPVRW